MDDCSETKPNGDWTCEPLSRNTNITEESILFFHGGSSSIIQEAMLRDDNELRIRSSGQLKRLDIQPSQGETLRLAEKDLGEYAENVIQTSQLFASFCGFSKRYQKESKESNFGRVISTVKRYAEGSEATWIRDVAHCPIIFMTVSDYTVKHFYERHNDLLSDFAKEQAKIIIQTEPNARLMLSIINKSGVECVEYLLPDSKVVAVWDEKNCLTQEMKAWLAQKRVLIVGAAEEFELLANEKIMNPPPYAKEYLDMLVHPNVKCEKTPLTPNTYTKLKHFSKKGYVEILRPFFSQNGNLAYYSNALY